MLRSSALDVVCTGITWVRVYAVTGVRPTPAAAAAHVLLRLSLSLLVYCAPHCQRRANLRWARGLFSCLWPQPYQARLAAKSDESTCNILRSHHTPVYSSILCCSNPTMLSHIAAASGKDLELVGLERLSGCGTGVGAPQPPPAAAGQLAGPDAGVGATGTEAYDLARRLVSSAGAGGSTEDGGSYTSAARKFRVSVKIPDRSPEDLTPGWDTDLHINGQRPAMVFFTYIRRGCIQLVLDVLCPAPPARAAAAAAAPPLWGTAAPPRRAGQRSEACGSPGAVGAGPAAGRDARHEPATSLPGPSDVGLAPAADGAAEYPVDTRGEVGGASMGADPAALPLPGGCVHGQLLHALCSDALFAGRTLTLQVGATASLVRVQTHSAEVGSVAAAGGCGPNAGQPTLAVAGPAPALPPSLRVRHSVVCTSSSRSGGWLGLWPLRHPPRRREVVLACSWDGEDDCSGDALAVPALHTSADGGRGTAPGSQPRSPELQLTVRHQGRFLPVVLVQAGGAAASTAPGMRQSLQAALARGNVAATVGPSPGSKGPTPETDAATAASRGPSAPSGSCLLAFTPLGNNDGLAQVELCRDGCHSAQPASVLLVSSPAIAFELEQLQAVAAAGGGGGGGMDLGAAQRAAVVEDVVRDFGSFLDIVPALSACGSSCGGGANGAENAADLGGWCSQQVPLLEWCLAPVDETGFSAPVASRVVFLRPRPSECAAADAGGDGAFCGAKRTQIPPLGRASTATTPPAHAAATGAAAGAGASDGSCGGAETAAADVGRDDDDDDCQQECRALALASMGCRIGLNLLRYFLWSGMTACAMRVLDVLHSQLGVPPALLASPACCAERMTLLHHAARSGSFRTVAALATWMEARGLDPGWSAASPGSGGGGITPLHLLAVVPGVEAAATCAMVQLRWPGARAAWHGGGRVAAGATPAHFAAMARSGAAAPRPWWERAAGAAPVTWAVGGAWRCTAAVRRRLVLQRLARSCGDALAPALGFIQPSLESSYVAWFDRRVAFTDYLFLSIYTLSFLIQAVKDGRAIFAEAFAAIILLAVRLALHSRSWGFLQRWWRCRQLPPAPLQGLREAAQGGGKEDKRGSETDAYKDGVFGGGQGRCWLLASREYTTILMELLRLAVYLLLAAGMMRLPYTWARLVQLRLDVVINAFIRPMRMLPSLVSAVMALIGEAEIMVVIWQPVECAALAFALALARGCITHGLGLCLSVVLQTTARARFLAEMRGVRSGAQGSKAG
ncbi:hypothetical protein PLESTB_000471300 [Pleodorina starrii]|uniref:Uncharacterized protein n=1 Tax=Pleodorina starrii TaxID=330485 RepID=A0A9W6EZZ4_9CHLO|nr:hypothetical protein PLESTB_000471300 [Pleodorina starrii]